MHASDKTKAQILQNLTSLGKRLYTLEGAISARRQTEQALQESDKRYRHLVESSQGLICTHDLNGVLLFVNPAAATLLGYAPHEGVGRNLREFITPAARPLFDAYLERIRQQPKDSGFMRLMTKGGTERVWVYRNVKCTEAGKPPYVLGHAQDVTELIHAKTELRHIAMAMEAINESIMIIDTAGIVQYVNPAFERLSGYSRKEVVGQAWQDFVRHIAAAARHETVWETLRQDTVWSGTSVHQKKDGTLYDTEDAITAVYNSVGELTNYVVVGRDLTGRQRSEEALQHAERPASIGTLAAGIAHEINNPIGTILLTAQSALQLKDAPDREAQLEHALHSIISHSKRCGQIVKNFSRFARQEPSEKWPADLNTVMRCAVELSRSYADTHGIVLERQLAAHLPLVMINPGEMEQVFVNLLRNAIEASHVGRRVQVCTASMGSTIRSSIRDEGVGIAPETQRYVFEPFYTTRRLHGGMGLGLSIAHSIVIEHRGTIEVQSQPGLGTAITIDLPAIAQSMKDTPHA